MSAFAGIAAWLRALVHRRRADADLDEEIRFHLEIETEKNLRAGMPPAEARRIALAHFGGVQRVREEHRDGRRLAWLEDTAADARYALRALWRTPGVTTAIVLTLALGIGANAAIFSVLDRIFFRMPAGVASPGQVVRLYEVPRDAGADVPAMDVFSYPQYAGIVAAVGASAAIATYDPPRRTVVDGDSGRVFSSFVGPGYFALLGVHPALGRLFAPDEERLGAPAFRIVISYDWWQRRFGGDSTVIGRTLRLGDSSCTIVGVAARGFAGVDLDQSDFWRPLSDFTGFGARGSRTFGPPWYEQRSTRFLRMIARPAPGVPTLAVGSRATAGVQRDARRAGWGDSTASIVTGSLIAARGPGRQEQELALSARIGVVALLVLLIACANVGNLLLARAAERRREIAVRLSLGVSRGRLARMLLTESALLAAIAGVAAWIAARWCGGLLRALLLPDAHWQAEVHDARMVLFTAGAALFVACATALAPALHAVSTDVTVALKSGVREGGGHRSRVRTALVLAQSGLAAVLLIGAGLFVRSLHNVASQRIGYDVDRLVFAAPDVPRDAKKAVRAAAARELASRLGALSGVEAAALVSNPPIYGVSWISNIFRQDGDSLVHGGVQPSVTVVSPSLFATTGMRIMRGRTFDAAVAGNAARQVVVNESMARRFWPRTDPIGQCMRFASPDSSCFEIVGVAEDAHSMRLIERATPQYYLPAGAAPVFDATWVVLRARRGQAAAVAAAAHTLIGRVGGEAEPQVLLMSDLLAPQLRAWRLGAWLFTALAVLALLVAAMGVYSSLTYATTQRVHEIGVRMALGARPGRVAGGVVRDGVRVVATGVVLGIGLALVLGRLVAALLYGVSPHDPVTFGGAAVVLLGAAAVAGAVPAWRATRVDPVAALRTEA